MLAKFLQSRALKWPYVATVPLLAAGFGMSSFFTGTDTLWFAPPLACLYAIFAVVLAPGFRAGWEVPRSAVFGLALLFAAYVAVSALWSNAPYISWLFVFVLTALPLLFAALVMMREPGYAARLHMGALLAVLCGLAVWAWVQFFLLFETYGPRIHHPMLSPNNLAALFLVGLFAAAGLFVMARGWRAFAAFLLFVLLVMALIATQSRGGMIFGGAAMLVFVVALRRHPGLTWGKGGAMASAALLCGFAVNYFSSGWLGNNLAGLAAAAQTNSLTDRLSLYESSLAILRDHFWGGIGLGTFYFTYPAYRQPQDYSDGFFAHMDPLQYGLEMGIMAPVIFYAVLVAVLWRTVRAVWRLPHDSRLRVEIMAAFCGMLAVLMHTHIDFHMYILVTLIALAVPLAWWYVASEEALGDRRRRVPPPPGPRLAWQGGLCIVLALLVSWPVRAAITTVTFPKAQAALESGRLAEAEERLDAIAAYAPRNYYRLYQYYGRLGVQKLLFGGQAMDRDEAMAVLRDAEEAFARAMHYNRDFTGIASDRGQLYFVAQGWLLPDGYARAEADLLRVVEKNPLDWDARIGLVNVYQVQGYFSKALRVLERGRQWPMPRGQTGLSLMIMEAELHLKLGDRAGYQQGLVAARQFAVDNGLVAVPTTAGTSAPPARD